jgi:hypothetical protein
MIDAVLNAIIPPDPVAGLPGASQIDFVAYVEKHSVEDLVQEYIELLAESAAQGAGGSLQEHDEPGLLRLVLATRSRNIRLFSGFLTHVFRAYYSHADVLARIGAGSVPPFPEGNELGEDDWSLLEPVYDRGPIYRLVPPQDSMNDA